MRRRHVPLRLRLKHVQHTGDDEQDAADEVREPVDAVEDALAAGVVDPGEGHDAADVEYYGASCEDEGGEEADFVEVVCCQFFPAGPPFPFAIGGGMLLFDGGFVVHAVDVVVLAVPYRRLHRNFATPVGGSRSFCFVIRMREGPARVPSRNNLFGSRSWLRR